MGAHKPGSSESGTSNPFKIFANIFIAFIGAGVLGLPYAFKEAGILEGTFILTFVGVISVKAMLLLVECKYHIIEKWETGTSCPEELFSHAVSAPVERLDLLRSEELLVTGIKEPSHSMFMPMLGNLDVSYGDVGFEALGSVGRLLVDFVIVLSQIGFCCAYLIFICRNMSDIVPQVEMGHWLLIVLPVLSLLTLLRHLNSLTLTSLLAQCSVILALSVVFWYDFEHIHSVRIHPREISFENLPFFTVIAVYCFEGAGLVLSLEGSLAKDVRHKFPRYFVITLGIVTLLYNTFGVCGYLSFGPETNQIITLNLPKGPGFNFSLIVKSCLCVSLFLTYPVMMFPVMKILERYFIPDASKSTWKGNILRGLVVLLSGMVVILVPNFADLMALVGACCCTLLSFILPGLFHLCLFRGQMSLKQLAVDWVLIIAGLLGTIFGVWNAVGHMGRADVTYMADSSMVSKIGATATVVQNTTQSVLQRTTVMLPSTTHTLQSTKVIHTSSKLPSLVTFVNATIGKVLVTVGTTKWHTSLIKHKRLI